MKKNSGIVHLLPLFVIAIGLVGTVGVAYLSTQKVASSSHQGLVLKSDDEAENDNSGSGSEDSDDDKDDDSNSGSGSSNSGSGSSEDQEQEQEREEIRVSSELRIKTREEADRQRVDIYEDGKKLRIETRDGNTVVSVEDEDGEDTGEDELEDGEEIEIESTESGKIRIRTNLNKFFIAHGLVEAQTAFPLSINTQTNELTVTTSAGPKVVTILPQQAVDNMLARNVIDRILSTLPDPSASPESTDEAELGQEKIELAENNNELVYELEGESDERLLGLFPVKIHKKVHVSATTGDLVNVDQTLLSRILDFLSN